MIPTPPTPPPIANEQVERVRQWKYRCAQSGVFGIPVMAVHFLGPRLGGQEAERWVGLFEALLAGWVLYVSALGMIADAVVRGRFTVHALAALVAVAGYGVGVFGFVASLNAKTPGMTRGFLIATLLMMAWSALILLVQRRGHSQ